MARIKKKAAIICCCALLAVVLLLGVALVTLYFTVLRPRPPRVVETVVDTQLNAFNALPPELNLSLAVEVTVHNPNHDPFRYGEVVTAVTYHDTTVAGGAVRGAGRGDPGAVDKDGRGAARAHVDAAKVVPNKLYAADVVTGALPFEAAALRPFKVSAAAEVACSVVLYPFKRESSSHCTSTVHAT